MVNLLLKNGANVNTKDHSGKNPLFDFNGNLLKNKHIFNSLIMHGANINDQENNGDSILHGAIKKEAHLYFVRFLLSWGASPNTRNIEGFTPVECVLQKNKRSLFKTMILYQQSEVQSDCFRQIKMYKGGEDKDGPNNRYHSCYAFNGRLWSNKTTCIKGRYNMSQSSPPMHDKL